MVKLVLWVTAESNIIVYKDRQKWYHILIINAIPHAQLHPTTHDHTIVERRKYLENTSLKENEKPNNKITDV